MATGLVTWSKTAASNGAADSNVAWPEGMAPSAVNDSARAEMASMAMWRDDNNGTITTGGTSTAYTVTTNQTFGTLTAGYTVCFCPHATNGDSPTLAVDGLTAKPIRSAPNTSIPSGTLVQGTPYIVTYATSNSGEWLLKDFYGNPFSVPIGGFMPFVTTTVPNSSFVLPYGQAISRSTYSVLFALVSTAFGSGDGSTTFNIPDLRGRVVAGYDSMGGSSANRLTGLSGGVDGDSIGAAGGSETHTLTEAQLAAHTHIASVTDPGHKHPVNEGLSIAGGAREIVVAADNPVGTASNVLNSATTGVTVSNANAGGSASHNNVQPTIILPYILRII